MTNLATTDTVEALRARLDEIESVLERLSTYRAAKHDLKELSKRRRISAIAARADVDEIMTLGDGDRRDVLASMTDLVPWLLSLDDGDRDALMPDVHERHADQVEVKLVELEPMVEIGPLASGSTHQSRLYELTQGQYEQLDALGMCASAKTHSYVERINGCYAFRGLTLDMPHVVKRSHFDVMLQIDKSLARYVRDQWVTIRELTRAELEARQLERWSSVPRHMRGAPLPRRTRDETPAPTVRQPDTDSELKLDPEWRDPRKASDDWDRLCNRLRAAAPTTHETQEQP